MDSLEPLSHFVDNYLGYLYELRPTAATFDGVHAHDDHVEDFSRAAIDRQLRDLGGFARRLAITEHRSQTSPLTVDVDLRATSVTSVTHTALSDDDPDAINTIDAPDRVTPRRREDPKLDGGRLSAVLPPLSWNMFQLS